VPRNAFGKARQEAFLAELAASCNVRRACAAAEVTDGCVYAKRRRDPLFREAWREAIDTGLARLEAMLIAQAGQVRAPEVRHGVAPGAEGEAEGEPVLVDKDLARHLVREHCRSLEGGAAKRMAPKPAEWSEVEDYFIAKLRALNKRMKQEVATGAPAQAPSTAARSPSPGSPGEECRAAAMPGQAAAPTAPTRWSGRSPS
jgi:hypothetical protein